MTNLIQVVLLRHYDYWDLRPLHLSIRVLYLVYCTLPKSAQLQYDVCCLWRRHVELRGRAATQPRKPRNALLGALRRQARGSLRLWELGARSHRRTLAHMPAGTLHSTVYTLQFTLYTAGLSRLWLRSQIWLLGKMFFGSFAFYFV